MHVSCKPRNVYIYTVLHQQYGFSLLDCIIILLNAVRFYIDAVYFRDACMHVYIGAWFEHKINSV